MSVDFKYVSVKLLQQCAVSLWVLSLSKNEWGGQLFPATQNGACVLTCNKKLIKGTELEEDSTNDKFYLGPDDTRQVMIASTPFFEEVFQKHAVCKSADTVNLFFHSHPLLIMPTSGIFSPPSIGDFFAHALLSNYRNFRQNNQLNTAIVAAFEGLYVYFPLPHRFIEFKNRVEKLWNQLPRKTKKEKSDFMVGELPERLVAVLKMEFFDCIRASFEEFLQEYLQLTDHSELSIAGAPILKDSKWNCKGCGPSNLKFPFYKFIQTQKAREFIRHNAYLTALHKNGLHYEFFPAPFTQDVDFLALMEVINTKPHPITDEQPCSRPISP